MAEPLLSVLVSVYNHEHFIEECLLSVAAQKVSFPIEVIVGEDCSTDGTREVLRRLETRLPETFTILYREHNLGAVANGEDLYARARGRYLADLEGDDFLTYPGKLQEQVDFLEAHPECSAVYHRCQVVGADSLPNGEKYPECPSDWYSFREFFFWGLPGQSGTLVCRTQDYLSARNRFMAMRQFDFYPGDRRNAFLFLTMGRVRCIQGRWSAYRHIRKGGSSHSANLCKDEAFARNEVGFGRTLVTYAERYGSAEALRTAKLCCYRMRFRWCHGRVRVESLGQVLRDALSEPEGRLGYVFSSVRWYAGLLARVLSGRAII